MQDRKVIGHVEMDNVLRFQVRRIVTTMFKSFLVTLEDLENEHIIAQHKLHEALPDELKQFVPLADYLTEERTKRLRSRVLDAGNDALRGLEEQLDFYDIRLRNPNA